MNKDDLKDLVKISKPFFELVRVFNANGKTHFEAKDPEMVMFFSGTFKNTYKSLDNGSVGLNRLGTLDGMLKFSEFNDDASSITQITECKDGTDLLSELEFSSPSGYKSTCRFMGSKMVDSQVKMPPFNGATWDVSFRPTTKLISNLTQFCGMLGGNDSSFTAKINNGRLEFHMGSQGTDRAVLPICDTNSKFKKDWSWPLAKFIAILKLVDGYMCTVHISSQAVIKIEVETDTCEYTFLMPAKKS
jgi:hypothetical protein